MSITLSRAIEVQTINNEHNPTITDEERRQAVMLGVKAMVRMQECRAGHIALTTLLLPGERKSL